MQKLRWPRGHRTPRRSAIWPRPLWPDSGAACRLIDEAEVRIARRRLRWAIVVTCLRLDTPGDDDSLRDPVWMNGERVRTTWNGPLEERLDGRRRVHCRTVERSRPSDVTGNARRTTLRDTSPSVDARAAARKSQTRSDEIRKSTR